MQALENLAELLKAQMNRLRLVGLSRVQTIRYVLQSLVSDLESAGKMWKLEIEWVEVLRLDEMMMARAVVATVVMSVVVIQVDDVYPPERDELHGQSE